MEKYCRGATVAESELSRTDGAPSSRESWSHSGWDPVDDRGTAHRAAFPSFGPEALQRATCLTRREREVLEMLATGAATHEAARRLRISADEVRDVVQSCKRALRAGSKLEAVLLALAAEVIRAPSSEGEF